MKETVERLRIKAQNEATVFALRDMCNELQKELAECKKERDMWKETSIRDAKRIDELRQKIDSLEPVAWMNQYGGVITSKTIKQAWDKTDCKNTPLYSLEGIK